NLHNIKCREAKINVYKDKDAIIISPFSAEAAGGKIEFRTKIDFRANKKIINIDLNSVNLAEIRDQLDLKDRLLAGTLSLHAYVENDDVQGWRYSKGKGAVHVRNGNIWEINLLGGVAEHLAIPYFESIYFVEGRGDLLFKDGNIFFEKIELASSRLSFGGAGKISGSGNIHFMFFPEFHSDLISSSHKLESIIKKFAGTGGLGIEVKGTLQKPTYKIKSVLFPPIEEFKSFLEGLMKQ
ncbi:MAG: hypothetical protein JSW40_01580, partial [Candidatus Omnitrophota bacterium]